MAYALTEVKEGRTKRLIICVPPRHLKSIFASVAFPAYVLGHDPTRRIICVSYSEALARKHANDCRALMRSSLYRRLFPRTVISSGKDTELEFMTTARGCRLATSVGGTLTGRGGNLIIIDDPLKPQEAYSESAREQLRQWYGNTLLSRLDSKAHNPIIVVMQRLHVDDLVGHLLDQEGWEVLSLSAVAETSQVVPLSSDCEYHRESGEVLHREREPKEVLDEIKQNMGSVDFAAQYQQEPVPPGGHMINWSWFKFYDSPPPLRPGDRIILSWDTASSVSELADYSACVTLMVRGQAVYVLDVLRARMEYPTLRRNVLTLYAHWLHRWTNCTLLIENTGTGMSLIQDLRSLNYYPVPVDPRGDKVLRMHAQTARIEAGAVHLPACAPWLEDFRSEVLAFPHGRHDDQVDALSQALHWAFTRRWPVAAVGVRR
jgi:predicted phage terminase large subunit-like protein